MAMRFRDMDLHDFEDLTTVQGGADTFVCTALETGIDRAGQMGWFVTAIDLRLDDISEVDSKVEVQLSARTKTALCTEDDYDLIWHKEIKVKITTSGSFYIVFPLYEKVNRIIACDPLYLIIGSSSTGLTNRARLRVWKDDRKIPEALRWLAWY